MLESILKISKAWELHSFKSEVVINYNYWFGINIWKNIIRYIFLIFLFTFPGDSMFNTLRRYGLYYDSSMSTAQKSWPYTLEYRMPHSCSVKPCPTESHPGKVYLFCKTHVVGCIIQKRMPKCISTFS